MRNILLNLNQKNQLLAKITIVKIMVFLSTTQNWAERIKFYILQYGGNVSCFLMISMNSPLFFYCLPTRSSIHRKSKLPQHRFFHIETVLKAPFCNKRPLKIFNRRKLKEYLPGAGK